MNDLKKLIVESARKFGADLVGFASVSRFDGVDKSQHPFSIFPECKTVIGSTPPWALNCWKRIICPAP